MVCLSFFSFSSICGVFLCTKSWCGSECGCWQLGASGTSCWVGTLSWLCDLGKWLLRVTISLCICKMCFIRDLPQGYCEDHTTWHIGNPSDSAWGREVYSWQYSTMESCICLYDSWQKSREMGWISGSKDVKSPKVDSVYPNSRGKLQPRSRASSTTAVLICLYILLGPVCAEHVSAL